MLNYTINDFTEKHLIDILSKHNEELPTVTKDESLELEIRFKGVTRGIFESLYTAIGAGGSGFVGPVLECSVNVTSSNIITGRPAGDTSYIRKLVFKGPALAAEIYQKKTRLIRSVYVDDYIKYSVGLSKETTIPKFNTSNDANVRFKVRVSYEYEGKWRYDLTAIRSGSLSGLKSTLKTIKHELFTSTLSASDLLGTLNFASIDSFEVEIEYIGKKPVQVADVAPIVHKTFSLVNTQYLTEAAYQKEIYSIAEYIITNHELLKDFRQPTHRLKQLGNQVMSLTKNSYYIDVYPPDGYYLTIKADGLRVMVSVDGNRCRVLKSNDMMEYTAGDKHVPGEVTIVDAEMIEGKAGHTIYVFDVLVLRNENISKEGFSSRMSHIEDAAVVISNLLTSIGASKNITIVPKKYVKLAMGTLEANFREMWESEYSFPRDGLIITEPSDSYIMTKNYKWKPADRNTIDFLAVKAPQKMLGIKPYEVRKGATLYLLFVGISHTMRESLGLGTVPQYHNIFPALSRTDSASGGKNRYYPIQFSPSANPLAYIYYYPDGASTGDIDKKIVELSRNTDDNDWIFHGIRTDRKMESTYYGNDFRTAELTYTNVIDPFPLESLWKPSDSYFTKTADGIYSAPNKYKRFVISVLLSEHIRGMKYIIDLASGRGADLHRYQELGVENAIFIDIDATAIAELIRRKYSFFTNKRREMATRKGSNDASSVVELDKIIVKDTKALTVHTLVADLMLPYKGLVASTFQFGVNEGIIDGIVCNFALHYMCDTIEHLRNILLFVAHMLKVGGVFIFTVMDGSAVFDLLRDISTGKCWVSKEETVTKYAIRKDYVGDKLSDVNQMISVMLPFSDKLYQEPLCNIKTVISEASKVGLKVEINESMSAYMGQFARASTILHSKLTKEDHAYIGLHRSVVLRLMKRVK